ncbi:MAG TPA: hypothetical protein VK939_04800, partial [Longimicrobiales bacterium]|nr:hypothetical protein [Longimicrobiales bacterium]
GSASVAPAGGGPPASMTAPGSQAPPSAGASPVAAAGPGSVPVFGTKDPHARAERIARALVSDIVAYHPKKRVDALAAGTMRTEFREEIMKSWEEYVAQVGAELAKGTPYFRNALNDILAQGQRIF